MEAITELLDNNPQLAAMNDYPPASLVDAFCNFDIAMPIIAGTNIYINDESKLMNKKILRELNGKQIISTY